MTDDAAFRPRFLASIDVRPDPFQIEAFDAIDIDENVLVAAPTSSGKTLVADYAIDRVLAANADVGDAQGARRVFYTTPIKALSNQKFGDLTRRLGADQVGLLTGDNVVRPDAPIVVMTTEVLRNMIYAGNEALDRLAVVVLDEVHYLQDTYRGPVWEEVIIQTPEHVSLVGLSATVSNAHELAEWIEAVRGTCRCVVETTRPVELQQRFLVADRVQRELVDLRTLKGGEPHRETARYIARHQHGPKARGRRRLARPRRTEIVRLLDDKDRLPAIFFIFSRQGCDDAVGQCLGGGLDFLDPSEAQRAAAIAGEHTRELSDEDLKALGYRQFLDGLQAGIAAHHAGMVPPFKEAVEECFQAGLLKVVFATETLALGVNMPARSVVIEQLSRFRGEGHVMLTPGDFAQLTGRAGRRGIDDVGYAYTTWSPFVEFDDVARLAGSTDYALRSVFRPTYNMAANLVATRTEEGAVDLLQRSFAQFQADRQVVGLTRQLGRTRENVDRRAQQLRETYGTLDEPPSARAERRRATNTAAAPSDDPMAIERALGRMKPGDVLVDDRRRQGDLLLVLGVSQRRHGGTRLRVVTIRGKTMMLSAAELATAPDVIERLSLPKPYRPERREFQKEAAAELRAFSREIAVSAPEQPFDDGEIDIERWRVDHQRYQRAVVESSRVERRLESATDGLGHALRAVVDVLREVGHVEGWSLTERGASLRRVFHEHDLWITESVMAGVFDGLDPARLAGVASAMTYQQRGRGDGPAPWFPDEITKGRVGDLRGISRRLASAQRRHGQPETPEPDAGFVAAAHAWALGIDLGELLAEEQLSGGDFVRQIRQLSDLLRQIAAITPNDDTAAAAHAAGRALDRGLVAAANRVSDGPASSSVPEFTDLPVDVASGPADAHGTPARSAGDDSTG